MKREPFFQYLVCLAVFLSGCEKTVVNRGYNVILVDFDSVKVGTDTASTVFKKIGSPSFRSSVLHDGGEYCWYYSGEQMSKRGVMTLETVNTKTYVITFNSADVVKSVSVKQSKNDINFEKDTVVTKLGKSKGILTETFGGMGRYIDAYSKKQ